MHKQRRLNLGFVLCLGALAPLGHAEVSVDDDLRLGVQAFERADIMGAMGPLERAAHKGYPKAQYLLGYIMERGEENAAAYQWFAMAAEQGDADSQVALSAMIFQKKLGIEHDKAEALRWLQQAAGSGSAVAMNRLALIYAEGRHGVTQDLAAAVAHYLKSAESGDTNSMSRLVQAFTAGELGLSVDPAKAAEWSARIAQAKQK